MPGDVKKYYVIEVSIGLGSLDWIRTFVHLDWIGIVNRSENLRSGLDLDCFAGKELWYFCC